MMVDDEVMIGNKDMMRRWRSKVRRWVQQIIDSISLLYMIQIKSVLPCIVIRNHITQHTQLINTPTS